MLKLSRSRAGTVATGAAVSGGRSSRGGCSGHRGRSGPRGAWPQNQPRGGEDGGAHGARADGCAIDVVRRQRVGAAAQRPAGFTGQKRIELTLPHLVVDDHRLLVEDDLGPRDAAAEVDAGDDVERRRRVTGCRDDVQGRKHVGDNLLALENRDRRRRAFLQPEAFGPGIDHRHDLGRQPFAQLARLSNGR